MIKPAALEYWEAKRLAMKGGEAERQQRWAIETCCLVS